MNSSEPTPQALRLRSFRSSDSESCCNIFLSNVPKFFRSEELPEFRNYLRMFAEGSYWVVATEEGEVIACGGIHIRAGDEGTLCFGMVRSDFHRQGIGSALLAFRILELLKVDNLRSIRLDTSQHNPGFFSRFGFQEIGTQTDFYGDGLHRCDMQLHLIDCDKNAIKARFVDFLRADKIKIESTDGAPETGQRVMN